MKTSECIGYGDGISEEDHPVVGGGIYNEKSSIDGWSDI